MDDVEEDEGIVETIETKLSNTQQHTTHPDLRVVCVEKEEKSIETLYFGRFSRCRLPFDVSEFSLCNKFRAEKWQHASTSWYKAL
jgi:hypothetical protein